MLWQCPFSSSHWRDGMVMAEDDKQLNAQRILVAHVSFARWIMGIWCKTISFLLSTSFWFIKFSTQWTSTRMSQMKFFVYGSFVRMPSRTSARMSHEVPVVKEHTVGLTTGENRTVLERIWAKMPCQVVSPDVPSLQKQNAKFFLGRLFGWSFGYRHLL